MKVEKNERYYTIAVYTILTSLSIVIGTLIIFNFKIVLSFAWEIIILLSNLLQPLIFGIIFAYLLDPIVNFYDGRCGHISCKGFHLKKDNQKSYHKSKECLAMRTLATLLTFMTVITILGIFILMIVLNIQDIVGTYSIGDLQGSIREYIEYFEAMLQNVSVYTGNITGLTEKGQLISRLYSMMNDVVINISRRLMNSIMDIGMSTMNILLALVIAFYLLQDKRRMLLFLKKVTSSLTPSKAYKHIVTLAKDIDYVFSGYIRGQLIDATIIAILTSIALTLIRLDFAIIIGIVAGAFNLIPYFGPVVGFILAGLIGLMGQEPIKALYGVLALILIQQIDGWIIVPKVVGESVKLHPVVVLLSILIGGNLFGLIGMLIAVPVAAFIRIVLLRYVTGLFPDGEALLAEEELNEKEQEGLVTNKAKKMR